MWTSEFKNPDDPFHSFIALLPSVRPLTQEDLDSLRPLIESYDKFKEKIAHDGEVPFEETKGVCQKDHMDLLIAWAQNRQFVVPQGMRLAPIKADADKEHREVFYRLIHKTPNVDRLIQMLKENDGCEEIEFEKRLMEDEKASWLDCINNLKKEIAELELENAKLRYEVAQK